jgi:hypothetical protein
MISLLSFFLILLVSVDLRFRVAKADIEPASPNVRL